MVRQVESLAQQLDRRFFLDLESLGQPQVNNLSTFLREVVATNYWETIRSPRTVDRRRDAGDLYQRRPPIGKDVLARTAAAGGKPCGIGQPILSRVTRSYLILVQQIPKNPM